MLIALAMSIGVGVTYMPLSRLSLSPPLTRPHHAQVLVGGGE